jgi:hypothetical protein
MPSTSIPQEHFMAADYGRAKAGEPTKTGMSQGKLGEWVHADAALEHKKKALKGQMSGGGNVAEH